MLDFLRRRGRLSEEESRVYVVQLAEALAHCHKRGVVHRNLKLQNVLLGSKGIVKLTSFGFANEVCVNRFSPLSVNFKVEK